jgi:hypothetical protein
MRQQRLEAPDMQASLKAAATGTTASVALVRITMGDALAQREAAVRMPQYGRTHEGQCAMQCPVNSQVIVPSQCRRLTRTDAIVFRLELLPTPTGPIDKMPAYG